MKKLLTLLFLIAAQGLLVNCAKSNDSRQAVAPSAGYCGGNQAYTQYGCLPTGFAQCQAGYGYSQQYGCVAPTQYNNGYYGGGTCSAGMAQTQYGCLPTGTQYCQAGYGYSQQYGCVAPSAGGVIGGGGACQSGTVGTVMGCLPQGSCPVGYGYYYGVYNGQTGGWCYQQTY